MLEVRIFCGSDENARRAAAIVKEVFPVRMIAREFFLDARTNGWIFQSLKQFLDSAICNPRRKRGSKRRGPCCVGIHVRGNIESRIARELDGGDDVFHAAPAGLAADF